MRRQRDDDLAYPPVTRICSYCDEHRKLRDRSYSSRKRESNSRVKSSSHSSSSDKPYKQQKRRVLGRQDEFSRDEIPVDSSSAGRPALFRSSSIIRKADSKLDSPTSCLKKIGSKKESGCHKKRVNFHREKSSSSAKASSEGDYWSSNYSYENESDEFDWKMRLLKEGLSSKDRSSSSDYRADATSKEPFRRTITRKRAELTDESELAKSRESSQSSAWWRTESKHTGSKTPSQSGSVTSDKSRKKRSKSRYTTSSSSGGLNAAEESYESVESEERRLLDRLNSVSLTSSTCCSDGRNSIRVVRPRDEPRRPAVERMLVYPPEGQSGRPIGLCKKWSNIDCHVKGDPVNGYRYKVYYLQKFESDKWFPDPKTGGPFRRIEDGDCTTDYG